MKRTATPQEKWKDENYQRECGLLHALVLVIFRRSVGRVVHTVVSRAYERGLIDIHAVNELYACCDRILWPEMARKTHHVVQSDNTVGGDLVGGDLYK